jgi:diaminohydroxyphosphoribosylaminopyrimidine deaminase/5-amino-6-(5-phosphoribosylamino)uracil reductase
MPSLKSGFGIGGRIDRALNIEVTPSFSFGSDEYWMEQALITSMEATGLSPPNPSVGCVLVKDQILLAKGFTQATGHEHAERMAFLSLPENTDLSGVTAYVTLEPCSHFGSQPPCVDLFLNSKIKRVVIACQDPDERVNGQGIAKLKAKGIEVTLGVLEAEAKAFLFPFFGNRIWKRPVWIGKWAQTPNGFLADAEGHSKWISNPKSRAYTHWLRQKYDLIVVGAETYLKDSPKLNVRDSAPPHHRDPIPVVFDPKGKLLKHELPEHLQLWVGEEVLRGFAPASNVFAIPTWKSDDELFLNFKQALEQHTFSKPLQSIMVEGGATLLNGFLDRDYFDAIHQFLGTREFQTEDPRYQIRWKPESSWNYATSYYFDEDHLQEWLKGF